MTQLDASPPSHLAVLQSAIASFKVSMAREGGVGLYFQNLATYILEGVGGGFTIGKWLSTLCLSDLYCVRELMVPNRISLGRQVNLDNPLDLTGEFLMASNQGVYIICLAWLAENPNAKSITGDGPDIYDIPEAAELVSIACSMAIAHRRGFAGEPQFNNVVVNRTMSPEDCVDVYLLKDRVLLGKLKEYIQQTMTPRGLFEGGLPISGLHKMKHPLAELAQTISEIAEAKRKGKGDAEDALARAKADAGFQSLMATLVPTPPGPDDAVH